MKRLREFLTSLTIWHEVLIAFVSSAVFASLFLAPAVFQPNTELIAADVVNFYPPNRSLQDSPSIDNSIVADNMMIYYPRHWQTWDAVRKGNWPTYDPYSLLGRGSGGLPAGYVLVQLPGFLTAYLTGELATSFTVNAVFHLAITGSLMYLLLRHWKASRTAAALGSVIWMFAQHQIVWLHFPAHLQAQMLIPLVLYLFDRLFDRGDWWRAVWFGSILAFWWTLGYNQVMLYFFLFMGAYFWFRVWLDERWRQPIALSKTIGLFVAALVIFLALGGYTALNQANAIQSGIRGTQTAQHTPDCRVCTLSGFAESVSLFIQPKLLGDHVNHAYNGLKNLVETGRYMTWWPLIVPVVGIWNFRSSPNGRLATFLTTVAIFTFLLMEGAPGLSDLMYAVPLLELGQATRLITIVLFAATAAMALCLDEFLEWVIDFKIKLSRRSIIAGVTTILVSLAVLFILWKPSSLQDFYTVVQWWFPAFDDIDARFFLLQLATVPLLVSIYTAWILGWRRVQQGTQQTALKLLLLGLVFVELWFFQHDFNTYSPRSEVLPETEIQRELRSRITETGSTILPVGSVFLPNSHIPYQLPIVSGYSTSIPQDLFDQLQQYNPGLSSTYNGYVTLGPSINEFTDAFGVKYVLSEDELQNERLSLIMQENDVYLYEVLDSPDWLSLSDGELSELQYWRDGVTGSITASAGAELRFAEPYSERWRLHISDKVLHPEGSAFNTIVFILEDDIQQSVFNLTYQVSYARWLVSLALWMIVFLFAFYHFQMKRDRSSVLLLLLSLYFIAYSLLPFILTNRIAL